jgi:hypothetical protein
MKKTPSLPRRISAPNRRMLKIIKSRGEVVSGSFAQESLLKRKFTRPHVDLDILTKNRPSLMKAIKKEFGNSVRFKKLGVSIEVKYRGKPIADLVEFAKGEGGFVKKFKSINVQGIKVVDPRARLGGKLTQIRFSKITPKGLRDIRQLSGGRLNLDTPQITGVFSKSRAQLRSSIGKRGPVVTAQEDFFRQVAKGKKTKLPKGKAGMEIITDPSGAESKNGAKVVIDYWESWAKENGSDFQEILHKAREVLGK